MTEKPESQEPRRPGDEAPEGEPSAYEPEGPVKGVKGG